MIFREDSVSKFLFLFAFKIYKPGLLLKVNMHIIYQNEIFANCTLIILVNSLKGKGPNTRSSSYFQLIFFFLSVLCFSVCSAIVSSTQRPFCFHTAFVHSGLGSRKLSSSQSEDTPPQCWHPEGVTMNDFSVLNTSCGLASLLVLFLISSANLKLSATGTMTLMNTSLSSFTCS